MTALFEPSVAPTSTSRVKRCGSRLQPGPQNGARQEGLLRGTGSRASSSLRDLSSAENMPSSCETAPIAPV